MQTLKLERCNELIDLPGDMKNMVGLRHLHFDSKLLNRMPLELGKLVNLQSLPAFIVGTAEGCGIGELKNMRFLRGSICIKNLENVSNLNEAKEAMLDMKPFINKLELEWSDFRTRFNDAETLAGLCPHESLEELSITNYNGFLLPGWFSSPLRKLSRVHLQSCEHYEVLHCLRELQHLKSLVIEGMSSWSQIDLQVPGFPSLESLKVEDMPNLTHWHGFQGANFPCLRILNITDCPQLTDLPSLQDRTLLQCLNVSRCPEIRSLPGLPVSLQALTISESDILTDRCRIEEGEDWHKIRSVPVIEIDNVEITWEMRRL